MEELFDQDYDEQELKIKFMMIKPMGKWKWRWHGYKWALQNASYYKRDYKRITDEQGNWFENCFSVLILFLLAHSKIYMFLLYFDVFV